MVTWYIAQLSRVFRFRSGLTSSSPTLQWRHTSLLLRWRVSVTHPKLCTTAPAPAFGSLLPHLAKVLHLRMPYLFTCLHLNCSPIVMYVFYACAATPGDSFSAPLTEATGAVYVGAFAMVTCGLVVTFVVLIDVMGALGFHSSVKHTDSLRLWYNPHTGTCSLSYCVFPSADQIFISL